MILIAHGYSLISETSFLGVWETASKVALVITDPGIHALAVLPHILSGLVCVAYRIEQK